MQLKLLVLLDTFQLLLLWCCGFLTGTFKVGKSKEYNKVWENGLGVVCHEIAGLFHSHSPCSQLLQSMVTKSLQLQD